MKKTQKSKLEGGFGLSFKKPNPTRLEATFSLNTCFDDVAGLVVQRNTKVVFIVENFAGFVTSAEISDAVSDTGVILT
jgi:hypothetical protein